MLPAQRTLNCNGRLLTLDQPRIMGILNVTPDSFYAGSRVDSVQAAVDRAGEMLAAGADILDIGGMSTRPGARVIDPAEEADRVGPVIGAVARAFPEAIISVDTVYAETARLAVAAGAGMVNDISAGSLDPDLFATVAELQVPYVLMHMQGRPENMREHTDYDDLLNDIWDFLAQKIGELRSLGQLDIIVDPGLGFGKTIDQNFTILRNLHAFRTFDLPLMIGLSRKSMIWKTLEVDPSAALNGTTALHVIALQQGAHILRVHDVAPAREVVQLMARLQA
jgi:dihydropteroate synthase